MLQKEEQTAVPRAGVCGPGIPTVHRAWREVASPSVAAPVSPPLVGGVLGVLPILTARAGSSTSGPTAAMWGLVLPLPGRSLSPRAPAPNTFQDHPPLLVLAGDT